MQETDNLILGLDIGTTKICASICEIDEVGELNLRGMGTSITSGLTAGKIDSEEDLKRSIDRAINRAERMGKGRPTRVVTNVLFNGVQFIHNPGFVLSKSETGQVTYSEKVDCVQRSKNIVKSSGQTVMHAIPLYFKVDGRKVRNPVDVYGRNLEVETHIVLSDSETIYGITRVLRSLDLKISGFVYDSLASSQVLLKGDERRKGSLFLDIGGRFTKVCIFQNNLMYQAVILPIGGETFTRDVAHCLEVTVPEAERLKIVYGDVLLSRIDPESDITINTKNHGRVSIKREFLCQILFARVKELIEMVQDRVQIVGGVDLNTIVLGGGGSLLTGLKEYIRKETEMPVRSGLPVHMKSVVECVTYSSAVGLVLYALKTKAISYFPVQKISFWGNVRKWWKSFF